MFLQRTCSCAKTVFFPYIKVLCQTDICKSNHSGIIILQRELLFSPEDLEMTKVTHSSELSD